MPVYLFTYHAYRSWMPDHPRGFVLEGRGIQKPNRALAHAYAKAASQPPILFRKPQQEVLLWIVFDACRRRGWRLHIAACEPTHMHCLISWRGEDDWRDVSTRLKNLASTMLGRVLGEKGRNWFTRGSSRKRVRDREHFDHLMRTYLPSHRGLCWREGDPPPPEPKPPAPAGG